MDQIGEAELISERELIAATGIDRYSLRRVRRRLFIDFERKFPGRGSGTYYPAIAVPMVQRYVELRRATRKIDECVWRLWIEGFPIDMREWAVLRLAPIEHALVASIRHIEDLREGIIDELSVPPKRTEPRRPIHGRLGPNAARSLLHWAIDVTAGLTPAKSLYDPASPSFDALKNASGLIGNWEPPDAELSVESLSLSKLCDLLRNASYDELDQARQDWAVITQLIDESDQVDWRAVRERLDVQRTSSAQPIAPADFLIALWHDFEARAVLLAALIHFRRSPDHSHRVSEILALASWAIAQMPRRA